MSSTEEESALKESCLPGEFVFRISQLSLGTLSQSRSDAGAFDMEVVRLWIQM